MTLQTFFFQEVKQHYLFKTMPERNFHSFMQHSGLHTINKQELFIESGSMANHFYLVRSGQVVLSVVSPEGKEKAIKIIESGETFAESLLFSELNQYPYNAKTLIETQLIYFDIHEFKKHMRQSNELCFAMMTHMSKHIIEQTQEIIDLSIHDAQYRLIRYLLSKCSENGEHSCKPFVELTISKALLASRFSITSETLSRIFSQLKKQGFITINHEKIILNDPEQLKQLIGEASLQSDRFTKQKSF